VTDYWLKEQQKPHPQQEVAHESKQTLKIDLPGIWYSLGLSPQKPTI
jgi:hypothetical protein